MDEYDTTHKTTYDEIINIYADDSIDKVIEDFFKKKHFSNSIANTLLAKEIDHWAANMRGTLNSLNNRYVTNVGFRLFHYVQVGFVVEKKSYLIQVWRGSSKPEDDI